MFDRRSRHGNGNKVNMRLRVLEGLLEASESSGGSATVNSLKHVIRNNKVGVADDAETSLNRMRMIYQNEISREIHQIVERHVRTTFSPAIENLKRNGLLVNDDIMNDFICGILDAAKKPFLRERPIKIEKENEKEVESRTMPEPYRGIPDKIDYYNQRGEESDDSEISVMSQSSAAKRRRLTKKEDERFSSDLSPFTLHEMSKWNPDRFNTMTQFVPASKVISLTLLTLSKFFLQYPRLFRYCIDDQDKITLEEERKMTRETATSYLLCLEDVREVVGRSCELEKIAFKLKEPLLMKVRRYAQPIYDKLRPTVELIQQQQQQPQQQQPQQQQQQQMMSPPSVALTNHMLSSPHTVSSSSSSITHNNISLNSASSSIPQHSGIVPQLSPAMTNLNVPMHTTSYQQLHQPFQMNASAGWGLGQ